LVFPPPKAATADGGRICSARRLAGQLTATFDMQGGAHAQWRMTGGVGDVLAGVVDRGDHCGEFVGMGCGDG